MEDVAREAKLKAAKEKLAKFQKKKSKGSRSGSSSNFSAPVPIPTINDAAPDEANNKSPNSTESFQELQLSSAAATAIPDLGSKSDAPYQQELSNNSPPNFMEIGGGESSEPVFTANEQYYYDLYLGAAKNCDMLASQFQESQIAYQQVKAEIGLLSEENQQLQSQIEILKSHLENVINSSKISSPVERQQKEEMTTDREIKAEKQLEEIRAQLEGIQSKEHDLLLREEEVRRKEAAISLEHDKILIKEQELDAATIHQQQLAQKGTEVDENTLHWLDYYQKRCEELEQLNSQLNEQVQQAQHQPPTTVIEDRNFDMIMQEVLDLKQQFKASAQSEEKIAKIEESNRQIIRLLEESSVSASFCKAVVELSKTNNHLLHFVSRNIVMSSSTSIGQAGADFSEDLRSSPAGHVPTHAVHSIPDTVSVRELVRARLGRK